MHRFARSISGFAGRGRGGYAGAACRGVRHYKEGARRFGVLGSRLREEAGGDSWGLQVGISHYNVSATIGM